MPASGVIVPLVLVPLPDTVLLPRDSSVPPFARPMLLLFVNAELETRAVSYGKINPLHATEIFIREGLVNDTITFPLDFIAHNRAVRASAPSSPRASNRYTLLRPPSRRTREP